MPQGECLGPKLFGMYEELKHVLNILNIILLGIKSRNYKNVIFFAFCRNAKTAYDSIKRHERSGKDYEDAWNLSSIQLVNTSEVSYLRRTASRAR